MSVVDWRSTTVAVVLAAGVALIPDVSAGPPMLDDGAVVPVFVVVPVVAEVPVPDVVPVSPVPYVFVVPLVAVVSPVSDVLAVPLADA